MDRTVCGACGAWLGDPDRCEPVAWKFKEVIHCGQGQFYDSDWRVSLTKPDDRKVCVIPLYEHPPVTAPAPTEPKQ